MAPYATSNSLMMRISFEEMLNPFLQIFDPPAVDPLPDPLPWRFIAVSREGFESAIGVEISRLGTFSIGTEDKYS